MRGCSLYRGWVLSLPVRDLAPSQALELARHLARCPACSAERERQESLSRALDRLPQVDVPPSFSGRVMSRLKRAAPALRGVGACLVLGMLAAAAGLASRFSPEGGSLLPHLRLGWGDAFGIVLAGFGRALLLVLTDVLSWPASGTFGGAGGASHSLVPAAPFTLVGCLALLVITVLLASSRRPLPTYPLSTGPQRDLPPSLPARRGVPPVRPGN